MKNKSPSNASAHISGRRTGLSLGLGLAFITIFFGSTVSAQVVVVNPTGEAKNVFGFAAQLAKTVSQLQQEVAQYEQLLNTVEGLGTNISFTPNQLQPISDYSSLIDQNCPSGTSGSIASSLVTSIASTISPTQSLAASQQQLCAQITMVQIDEYNKTVDIANQLGGLGGTLQKLNQLANEVNSLGTSAGATTQAETYTATVSSAMNDWQIKVAGDDKLIAALQQQQGILARVAMRGQNTPLGNVIQAGTLAAWFAANPYSQNSKIQ
jgi:hypothetical protein